MSDEKLEELVSEYASLASDKNIDTGALLMDALQRQDQNNIDSKTKRWAYMISIGVPPFGLLFAAWFYFSDKNDGKSSAIICFVLTAVSLIAGFILLKAILSGSGVSTQQLQQIKPSDVYQLSQ